MIIRIILILIILASAVVRQGHPCTPERPHCSRTGQGEKVVKCEKCNMPCNPDEGRKPFDPNCKSFCCEHLCDCFEDCP
jgi:hypothetical protein